MARGFGSTLGGGTTDAVGWGVAAVGRPLPRRFSFAISALRNGDGGSGFGRLFDLGFASGSHQFTVNPTTYNVNIAYTFTNAVWTVPRPATGVRTHIIVTFDSQVTTPVPAVYYDGVPQVVTTSVAPSGSMRQEASAWHLGNNAVGSRHWDGVLADAAFAERIWSAGEIGRIGRGWSPACFPDGLILSAPMSPLYVGTIGVPPIVIGTRYAPHPPTIYPRDVRRIIPVTAATGSGALLAEQRHRLVIS